MYILAQQSQQVYYILYPSKHHGREDWMAAHKVRHRYSFNLSEIIDTDNSNVYQEDEGPSTCLRPTLDIDKPIRMSGSNDEVHIKELIEATNATNQNEGDESMSEDSSDQY